MSDMIGLMAIHSDQRRKQNLDSALFDSARTYNPDAKYHLINGCYFQVVYLENLLKTQSYLKDGDLHLLLVGETYWGNHRKERQGCHKQPLAVHDILDLFYRNPNGFMHDIKGNYALVLIDDMKRRCTLYNSRFGISPFYYALVDGVFFFSTNATLISDCMPIKPEIDLAAIAESALFNYPLGDRTYVRQVKVLLPGEIVRADVTGVHRDLWWDVRRLFEQNLYSTHQALDIGSELFHEVVNDLASDVSKVRVSFTSGFDSRAIMAVLDKDRADILSYSFGTEGSLNLSIPKQICADNNMPFRSIYLDDEYDRVFEIYALKALRLSDGLATVERANYPYAFELLSEFSPVVMTGLFGSELLRTFQNVGHIVSENFVRINSAIDPIAEFRRIINEPTFAHYFASGLLQQVREEVEADISSVLLLRFGHLPSAHRFYMFLLTEGLRKYFGAEVHMERPWAINRFPFLDDDFVAFTFRAPFAGMHSEALKPRIGNRFRSQYFYAFIINKYRPELLNASTDHGYPPSDLLFAFPLLKIGPKFLFWRWKRKKAGYREFKTEEWTEQFYERHLSKGGYHEDIFSQKLKSDFISGNWKNNRAEFAKAASLKLWLEMVSLL